MTNKICMIGLGYIGLPLALAFAEEYPVIGFDINQLRIDELSSGYDRMLEVEEELLAAVKSSTSYIADIQEAKDRSIFIVTVPAPIVEYKRPNVTPLIKSSKTVGKLLNVGDIAVFESTVLPGATEEVCVPILEQQLGLTYIHAGNCADITDGFYCGYSPESVNPGGKEYRVTNIKKATSGSAPEVADKIDAFYQAIVSMGTHKASSLMVAEAAKVIENTQRDVSIALINELAMIFNKLDIDAEGVLKSAGTKWNFLPFHPGLVGGHCIGVDPYYLTHKTIQVGYHPEITLAGWRLNDLMGGYVAGQVSKLMTKKRIHQVDAHILIMGMAFKENCSGLPNTRVVDLVDELQSFNCNVDVYDPWVDKSEAQSDYGLVPVDAPSMAKYDAIIIAVAHDDFKEMGVDQIRKLGQENHALYDIKNLLPADEVDGRL